MNPSDLQQGEDMVAVFLTHTKVQRVEAASYLAHSYEARELLCMAQELLAAVQATPTNQQRPPSPPKRNATNRYHERTAHLHS